MFAKLLNYVGENLAPVIIAEGAEVDSHDGGLSREEWEQESKALFADFEGHGVSKNSEPLTSA